MKIGIIGFGKVSTSLVNLIQSQKSLGIEITKILVNHINKVREIDIADSIITDKYSEVIFNKEIDTIVDLSIDTITSLKYIKLAIENNKNVVTASRQISSVAGDYLLKQAKQGNVIFRFDGAIGCGIPVISTLHNTILCEEDLLIQFMSNSTVNYILDLVYTKGVNINQAIFQAKAHGFAEKNIENDLAGIDLGEKVLAAISSVFCGKYNYKKIIYIPDSEDILLGKKYGYKFKQLAMLRIFIDRLELEMGYFMLNKDNFFFSLSENTNGFQFWGDNIKSLNLSGTGVNASGTAMAVLFDLNMVKKGIPYERFMNRNQVALQHKYKYYLKIPTNFRKTFLMKFNYLCDLLVEGMENSKIITKSIDDSIKQNIEEFFKKEKCNVKLFAILQKGESNEIC